MVDDMEIILPMVLPVNELKNTSSIMKTCKESQVPIIITKNGYGEAVMMSIELFERLFSKVQEAASINEALDEIDNGAKPTDAKKVISAMKEKYAK